MTQTQIPVSSSATASGGHLVTTCGRTLPLRATRLVVRSAGGIATVQVVQTFANPFAEPLQVRYLLPLPADAAVAGFAFVLGGRRVTGEIDRRAAARERFEQAIASGRTAGLLEQARSALFMQELGNLPPGVDVTAEISIDQPLEWADGQWEWRFPTTVAPRYMGQAGRVSDAPRLDVPVADTMMLPRLQLDLLVQDTLLAAGAPTSPSHALAIATNLTGTAVQFAGAPMDRDVVVRWPVAAAEPGVALRCARPAADAPHGNDAYGLLTLMPPVRPEATARTARDLIVLLDVSGSMQGLPLASAQRVVAEVIASLDAEDRLEMIAFASQPQSWLGAPCFASAGNKAAALRWLMSLRASGSTEMREAILTALQPLRGDVQRQVVLVTDGQIGFEAEIVGAIRTCLPASSRVHVVGVGSAPNRSLTSCAARAGRGVEVLLGLDDDVAKATRRLLARTALPLVTDLHVSGTALLGISPAALPDLFGGAPAKLSLRLLPAGGTLVVRGATAEGPFLHELHVKAIEAGTGDAAITRLLGREQVEDLETELAANGDGARLTARIEQLGLHFGINTRATSWVAIDSEVNVDPRHARRVMDVPHEQPYGMSVEGLGLRAACSAAGPDTAMALGRLDMSSPAACMPKAVFEQVARESQPRTQRPAKMKDVPAPGSVVPRRPTHAVVRVHNATEWVFDLFGLEQWSLPARIVLVFADGREVVLQVVIDRSTRAGAVVAGTVVRLVATPPPGLAACKPTKLRLGDDAGARIVVIA